MTGNNPQVPRSNYASSDFDQTHVFLINYSYTFPSLAKSNKALKYLANGWIWGGQTVAESGQPYSPYDYHGSVAGIYYGTYDELGNPIIPLAPNVTAKQAELQGTTGINPSKPVLNPSAFLPQFLQPGQDGVPRAMPPDATIGSRCLGAGKGVFVSFPGALRHELGQAVPHHQGPLQPALRGHAFNIFNQPDFDTPNNDVDFFPNYSRATFHGEGWRVARRSWGRNPHRCWGCRNRVD